MANLTRSASIRGAGVAVLTMAALVALGPLANAATSSSSHPIDDIHSLGPITLWDKAGHRVTGGSMRIPLDQEIARATAAGPAPVGYRDAFELNMWTPRDGADPSQWNGGPLRAGSTDTIPGNRKTAPLSTSNISDWTLERDIVLCNGPSVGGYQNRYQLRLMGIQQGPTLSPTYYASTIVVDPAAGTWSLLTSSGATGASPFPTAAVGGGAAAAAVLTALGTFWWRRRPQDEDFTPVRSTEMSA